MVGSRTLTALAGLVVSLAITSLAWWYLGQPVLFLFVPLVPYLFWRRGGDERPPPATCPTCGFRTRDPEVRYCPQDGTALEGEGRGGRASVHREGA